MNDISSPPTGKTAAARRTWRPATQLVRGGMARSGFEETSEALYLTSGFVYPDAASAEAAFANKLQRFVYSRFANPTVANFEERLRLIEGAEAVRATASGMAAVYAALMACVKGGDRVVASRALFGSCQYILGELLPRFGVETTFVDGEDLDQWRAALAPGAACVFFETPSNPGLALVDVRAVCDLAHAAGATVVVDNVFASPLLQKPLELGADVVVYSATKHIDGQGRCLGGAILGSKSYVEEKLQPFLRHTGPALSPFNAWVLLKGLETLPLRIDRHVASAERVARHFEGHPKLDAVRYPFLDSHPQAALARRQMKAGGSIVCLDVAGGKEGAFRFLDALSLVDISNNLGDAKSLVTHPATTTHQRLSPEDRARQGIGPGLVRLSVGLEDVDDIIEDVAAARAAD
ncbi:O-succinylhomoserine sulfhydrylase [Stella sp.]|uniref:O-succinylhomoserine sulfhydrylase n=1 Tax=Stella sp. TaxID=2912054 RepID=UPI0035B1CCE5